MGKPAITFKNDIHWKLLCSVSALTLLNGQFAWSQTDTDRPSTWIELGYQFENIQGRSDVFLPPFTDSFSTLGAPSPIKAGRALPLSHGMFGEISFAPDRGQWKVSAAIRYGRSHGRKLEHVQHDDLQVFHSSGTQYPASHPFFVTAKAARFAEARSDNRDSHVLLDFKVGHDVGLGLFGGQGASTFNIGVRYAQLVSDSQTFAAANPDFHFTNFQYVPTFHASMPTFQIWHDFSAKSQNAFAFFGIGPSASWNGSSVLLGMEDSGAVMFDWGINAALLFGRQKTQGQHEVTGRYYGFGHYHNTATYDDTVPHARNRSVTVPNLGGFAGLSLKWTSAKLSLGYRSDFFFGAVDTGLDRRHETTRAFNGPFASINVGFSPFGL